VEDEPGIQELIAMNLESAGFLAVRATDAEAARVMLHDSVPDLAIVDWTLPGQSGVALIRSLRREPGTCDLPMIMLTARSFEHDKVYALENGADDYMTKPFSPRELVARVRAVLRRRLQHSMAKKIELSGLRIDPDEHQVMVGEKSLPISPTEFRLLYLLMSNPHRVYSRTLLLEKIWGMNKFIEERTVDAYVGRLRCALEEAGLKDRIETVRGMGYRFVDLSPASINS